MVILSYCLYGGAGLVTLIGGLLIAYTLYVAYVHWKYSSIPSPKRTSFYLGHLQDVLKVRKEIDDEVSFSVAVDIWANQIESNTFLIFLFHSPAIITLDSSVIKDVMMDVKNRKTGLFVTGFSRAMGERLMEKGLVTLPNYELWKPRRQLYDPTFKKSYLKTLLGTFNEMTNTTIEEIVQVADGKTVIPLKKYITKLATDIISKVAFGTDFSKIWTEDSLDIQVPKEIELEVFNYAVNTVFKAMQFSFNSLFPSLIPLLYPRKVKEYRKCIKALRRIGRDCIMRRIERIKSGEEMPNDILTYMLSSNNINLNMEELVDDFVTFYVAGQETTAIAMMFSIILICQHPNVLERLKQEISEVLGDRTEVTDKELDGLQYTEQVVLESLRLYSPVIGISRELMSPLQIGGFTLPAGLDIFCMGSNMSRRSEHFDDPDTFNPDRFHPDNKKPNSFVFFPFGIGHRSCVGKYFALMEAKIALARIIQTFTITFPEDYKIQAIVRVTLQPKDDLKCTISLND